MCKYYALEMEISDINNNLNTLPSSYDFGTFTAILTHDNVRKEISMPYEIFINNIINQDIALKEYIESKELEGHEEIIYELIELGVNIDDKFSTFALDHYTESIFKRLPELY